MIQFVNLTCFVVTVLRILIAQASTMRTEQCTVWARKAQELFKPHQYGFQRYIEGGEGGVGVVCGSPSMVCHRESINPQQAK